MNQKNRKWLLLISVPAIIGFLIVFSLNIFETSEEMGPRPMPPFKGGYRQIPISRIFLSPILLIVAVVPVSYYLISQRLEQKLEGNLKVISKLINKRGVVSKINPKKEKSGNIVFKFLNLNERRILEKLIEKKGTVLQSEISRMDGMTKLKTHRAVKDLQRKGIIKTEDYGKTNRIILLKDIKDFMFKDLSLS